MERRPDMKNVYGIILASLLATACNQEPQHVPAGQPGSPPAAAAEHEAFLMFNAVIYTMDEKQPTAGAMAYDAGGRILAVGDTATVMSQYPEAAQRNMQRRVVVPGLIDSHVHLHALTVTMSQAQLTGTASKGEVIQRLKEHEAGLPDGDWLLGFGWDQNDWAVREFPGRQDLDEHFPERPVWLERIDGHAGWANSAALALVERDLSGDWQPDGGFIHRDAEGRPTGVLIDHAVDFVQSLVPAPSEQLLVDSLDRATRRMVGLGLTGVHDMGVDRSVVERYRRRIDAGAFPVRVYALADGTGDTLEWLCTNGVLDHPSGRLVMRGVKLFADGALGSRGAALLADYSDDPGNSGLLFLEPEAMRGEIEKVLACGLQVSVHAIGDRANREVLDALAAALPGYPDNPGRHRIEHAQVLTAEDIPRFAGLGVTASMQPTHATSDMYWAEDRLGPERVRYAYAWRALLDSGARLAFGSDFPVEAINPMLGLFAAVTRQDAEGQPEGGWFPEERVTREEALRGFTLEAAHAAFMEERVGSLETGKQADFVVLDRDIMQVPAADILETRVLETWVDGKVVFDAEAEAAESK
jgi:predicted amidohydrolase YtcJ